MSTPRASVVSMAARIAGTTSAFCFFLAAAAALEVARRSAASHASSSSSNGSDRRISSASAVLPIAPSTEAQLKRSAALAAGVRSTPSPT